MDAVRIISLGIRRVKYGSSELQWAMGNSRIYCSETVEYHLRPNWLIRIKHHRGVNLSIYHELHR